MGRGGRRAGGGYGPEWRKFGAPRPAPGAPQKPGNRLHKRCVIGDDGHIYEPELAHVLGIQGRKFGSMLEGKRYLELVRLKRAGVVVGDIELQPRFELLTRNPAGLMERVGHYVADFRYTDNEGKVHVEDAKQWAGRTPLYEWKKRHMKAQFGIEIEEVG